MIEVGTRVRYITVDTEKDIATGYYPPVGTCGTARSVSDEMIKVEWDSGTDGDGIWWCGINDVEVVYTNVAVGDMLYADLSPVVGKEIGGLRPVVIREVYNDVVVVVPCIYNHETKKHEPHPYQIRAIDRSRLREKVDAK